MPKDAAKEKGKGKLIEGQGKKQRDWCWTSITTTLPTVESLREALEKGGARYYVFQLEEAPSTKRAHYQGYVYWSNPRYAAWKNSNPAFSGLHVTPCNGSSEQNSQYCQKPEGRLEGPWEFGECPTQGKRTDLEPVAKAAGDGRSIRDIAVEFPCEFIKYHGGIKALHTLLNNRERDFLTELWVFHGEPGTGKSWAAHNMHPEGGHFSPNFGNSGVWWDGYNNQETIIFDDFKSNLPLGRLKCLADRYACTIDIKGTSGIQFLGRRIIITTNQDFEEWYPNISNVERAALKRRIQLWVTFEANPIRHHYVIDCRKNEPINTLVPLLPEEFQ